MKINEIIEFIYIGIIRKENINNPKKVVKKNYDYYFRKDNFIWVKEGIKYFKDKIDLIPIFATLDIVNNMEDALHPTEVGYRQIGDQITSYLNSLT